MRSLFYRGGAYLTGVCQMCPGIKCLFALAMEISVNNVLFDRKNDDIGPESGLILPVVSSISDS